MSRNVFANIVLQTFPSFVRHTVCIPPAHTSTISSFIGTKANLVFSKISLPKPSWPKSPAPVTNKDPSLCVVGMWASGSVTKRK